jgi:DNA polymerase-3 subunit delta
MAEIIYKKLEDYLSELSKDSGKEFAPVYLIYGEEMLVKSAYEELIDVLIPAASRSLNFEPLDGIVHTVHDVIERVNTFSLLPGDKVVAFRDSKIFYARQDKNRLLQSAKDAHENNDLKKAATDLLHVMGQLNLSFDDISPTHRGKALGLASDLIAEDAWLDDIIEYCREQRLEIPAPQDDCGVLQAAIEKGFPKNNHLIITSDVVDKRRGLFKAIGQAGQIINCSVPRGERRADKLAQEEVLKETLSSMLQAARKKMNKAAYLAMYEMTGFDLRTFSSNLEKLINYVGDRENISIEDVESVLKRTKKDPIYDLTNAISDRKVQRAFFYLASILSADFHPLQVLAAIANQIRKLLLVKDFAESPYGASWHAGCPYSQFQNNIMPEIVAYDTELSKQLENWDNLISNGNDSAKQKKAKSRKKKAGSDLTIARNPKIFYPVYQLLKKSERFTKTDLSDALELVNEADIQLKSSRQNPKLVLEKVIMHICQA